MAKMTKKGGNNNKKKKQQNEEAPVDGSPLGSLLSIASICRQSSIGTASNERTVEQEPQQPLVFKPYSTSDAAVERRKYRQIAKMRKAGGAILESTAGVAIESTEPQQNKKAKKLLSSEVMFQQILTSIQDLPNQIESILAKRTNAVTTDSAESAFSSNSHPTLHRTTPHYSMDNRGNDQAERIQTLYAQNVAQYSKSNAGSSFPLSDLVQDSKQESSSREEGFGGGSYQRTKKAVGGDGLKTIVLTHANNQASEAALPEEIGIVPCGDGVIVHFAVEERILTLDFTETPKLSEQHLTSLAGLFENTSITVICRGLLPPFPKIEEYLRQSDALCSEGREPYKKFRLFELMTCSDKYCRYQEQDGFYCMTPFNYFQYLDKHYGSDKDPSFTCQKSTTYQDVHFPDAKKIVLYMIDVNMSTEVSFLNESYYLKDFKVKEILPGGKWCVMRWLPKTTQPFMGPNLYLCPGGGSTGLHQDGNGTADSGHTVLQGYNEVIMFKRLTTNEKIKACAIWDGKKDAASGKKILYTGPHSDGGKAARKKASFPNKEISQKWTDEKLHHSKFILRPGDHLHINKGRLHCFRKVRFDVALSPEDCFYELREQLKLELKLATAPLCISVAFDWAYLGSTKMGIANELHSLWECQEICSRRKPPLETLACPKTAIILLASKIPKIVTGEHNPSSAVGLPNTKLIDWITVCEGIYEYLKKVIEQEVEQQNPPSVNETISSIGSLTRPDTWLPDLGTVTEIDPYGNGNYNCILCWRELCNTYYSCVGCWNNNSVEYNICASCHLDEKYMEKTKYPKTHIPRKVVNDSQCNCEIFASSTKTTEKKVIMKMCVTCDRCPACRCVCHNNMKHHFRFYTNEDLATMLDNCLRWIK